MQDGGLYDGTKSQHKRNWDCVNAIIYGLIFKVKVFLGENTHYKQLHGGHVD